MAGVWTCLLLALVTAGTCLGLEMVSSHSRNVAAHRVGVHRGNSATQAAASYYDRNPSLRRLESSYRDSTNFGEHRAVNNKKVVAADYEHFNARPAMDTPLQLFKIIHPSPQPNMHKMQQEFGNRKTSISTIFSEDRERPNFRTTTSTKNANQPRSESNLMPKLKGMSTDFVDRTVHFFHPTRSGDSGESFQEQSRKIDYGGFRQTLLEHLRNSKPANFSAVEDFKVEKKYDVKNSSSEKLSIVGKTNQFEKHSIINESNTRIQQNLGEFVPNSWSETDDLQIKLEEEPVFTLSTGFNELNTDPELQLENEMDSLSGFTNNVMTLEILKKVKPVLADALEHSNFTEDELLNVLEDPDLLRQVLIEKTTDDHAMGLLEVFQHYKSLPTFELLENMTRLSPSELSQYVGGLASEVRDSLHKTLGLGILSGTDAEEVTGPGVAYDSHFSESSMYPTYADGIQQPPQESSSPWSSEYRSNFPHFGQYEEAQTRTGSINISNPLFNFSYVAPNVTFPTFALLHNLTSLTQKLNSSSSLLKLPLLAALVQTSVVGLGTLLALLIGSYYLKYDKGHGHESTYIMVSPKSGYNSRMYAEKKIIMELPAKKNLDDDYHRASSVKTVPLPHIINSKNVKTITISPKRHPGGRKKPSHPSFHSTRPPHRSDKLDTFDRGNPQIEYFTNEHGIKIEHLSKGDPFIFKGHKDIGYDSGQRGRSNHRSSYEIVQDSSVQFSDSSDEYSRSRTKPSRDRYYKRINERDRPRIKSDSLGRYDRSRETSRRKSKRPDRYRNFSRESQRGTYARWEEGRRSTSRPFLSREDDRRNRHRSKFSRRQLGQRNQSSKPEYRADVYVEDVLPDNMASDGDFWTQPTSLKVEFGVPSFEDDGTPSRSLRSSDVWMLNPDQIPSSSSHDGDYGNNMAQFGTYSSSLSGSPGYDTFRGRSEPTQRPRNTAASPTIKWALESPSHTSPHRSEAQQKDLVVWSDHPFPTSWSEDSTRRDQTSPSLVPLAIQDSSPISYDYGVLGSLDGDENYPDQQPWEEKDETRLKLDSLLQKYRTYSDKFVSSETTAVGHSASANSERAFSSPLIKEKPDRQFGQRRGELRTPRKIGPEKKRRRVQSGGFQKTPGVSGNSHGGFQKTPGVAGNSHGGFQKTPGVAGNSHGSSDRSVRPRQIRQESPKTMSPIKYIRSFFNNRS